MNKKIKKISLYMLSFFVIVGFLGYFYNINQSKKLVAEGDLYFDKSTALTYDISKAEKNYRKAYSLDNDNERALYQLIRTLYIQSKSMEAISKGEIYKKKYPEKKRIHYILGLTNGYAGRLDQALKEFHEFIKWERSNEAGYLDLAWVYFQKNDYKNAKKYLEEGIEKYGDNPWLNTSLAMAKFNLKEDKQESLALLEKAEKQLKNVTPEIWKNNYSSNDPNGYKEGIEKFFNIISYNKKIIEGKEDLYLEAFEMNKGLNFEGVSLSKGAASGYVVSACCASNYQKTCYTEYNECNEREKGLGHCSGSCLANKPYAGNYDNVYGNWEKYNGEYVSSFCEKTPTPKGCVKHIIYGDTYYWMYTVDHKNVAPGETKYIFANDKCRRVKNNGSKSIFIPTKTAEEWASFGNNAEPNIVKDLPQVTY